MCDFFHVRSVYLAAKKSDGKVYAVKKMNKADLARKNMVDQGNGLGLLCWLDCMRG